MLQRRDDPIPLEALRDLIGLVRAMYRAKKAEGAQPRELARYERVGSDLKEAFNMGISSRPGTMGYWAAWAKAEKATHAVADLVSCIDSAQPIVRAAAVAVGRRRATSRQ